MAVTLRPYQKEAVASVFEHWKEHPSALVVQATGTGKTIVFSEIAKRIAESGGRTLILAHREELITQARDKILFAQNIKSGIEKADLHAGDEPIVVGSVQTLKNEKRLQRFGPHYFSHIIIDEAHHSIAPQYQTILKYFGDAKLLGVTATPYRGDKKDLSQVFDSITYEYSLIEAITQGYLSPILFKQIPLSIDLSNVHQSMGDFNAGELGLTLDPYLEQIADVMVEECRNRKTVVFLPLIATSVRFTELLNRRGVRAQEINGNTKDRAEILKRFEAGEIDVLCNSMLLTEGWDCPSLDCIVNLRPTRSQGLYCLDEETEILTSQGWKKNVEIGENVATFNMEDNTIEFKPCIATVRRPLDPDEYFCSIKTPQVDIRVTNKHRMIYKSKNKFKWNFKEAQQLANLRSNKFIPISARNKFKGVNLSDDELRFLGWFMTDGCLNNNQIRITQSEGQPWFDDYVFTISKGEPRSLSDRHLRGWDDLEAYINKDLPETLFDMTEEQFDVMLEAIHLGDGSKQRNCEWTPRSYHITKGNKTFIERLQIMAIQRGWKANIAERMSNYGNPLYTLNLKKKDSSSIGGSDGRATWIKEKHTDENCWCVQTEAGTLVTRRNGKVAIVGNCQILGRGTRLHPGKENLLALDFLWHSERFNLCNPATLVAETKQQEDKINDIFKEGKQVDLLETLEKAKRNIVAEREATLAKELEEKRRRKGRLIDPIQYGLSVQAEDLVDYVPQFIWEKAPPSEKQLEILKKNDIDINSIPNQGYASKLISRLITRNKLRLSTPKQIRLLERYGFKNVGLWTNKQASNIIGRISANHWKVPKYLDPQTYKPEVKQ